MTRFTNKSFRSPKIQANKAMKNLNQIPKNGRLNSKGKAAPEVESVITSSNYAKALQRAAEYLKAFHNNRSLSSIDKNLARQFQEYRAETKGYSSINMERQALEKFMVTTGALAPNEKLPMIKSELEEILKSRAYTQSQISEIQKHQRSENSFSTSLAAAAGLRAHELLTINRPKEQPATDRTSQKGLPLNTKFSGLSGVKYTVNGKGGLIREVIIPNALANKLESLRLDKPRVIYDREAKYEQYYNLKGGKNWSSSFSHASSRAFGWSHGAHGLRHTFAQERMEHLQLKDFLDREQALETVSQELGHFRPDITECYLR